MNTVLILLSCLLSSSLPRAISFRYFPRSYLRQGKISVAFYVVDFDPVLIYGTLKRKCQKLAWLTQVWLSLLGFASHKGFLWIRIAQFSFADGLQDQAFQYFFQYLFLLFMISLIFRQACAELKREKTGKCVMRLKALNVRVGGGGGNESAWYILENEAAITCRA